MREGIGCVPCISTCVRLRQPRYYGYMAARDVEESQDALPSNSHGVTVGTVAGRRTSSWGFTTFNNQPNARLCQTCIRFRHQFQVVQSPLSTSLPSGSPQAAPLPVPPKTSALARARSGARVQFQPVPVPPCLSMSSKQAGKHVACTPSPNTPSLTASLRMAGTRVKVF